MAESKRRIRVLRQVEHGVLSKVENVNGIVSLLKELDRENETPVAVAATHCLRRLFSQLLDPTKNPQLPRRATVSAKTARGVVGTTGEEVKDKKKNRKKRARAEDVGGGGPGGGEASASEVVVRGETEEGVDGGDKAARVYQSWLEARYFDFLRVMLSWVAEVEDYHRQGTALRTLMQFVEMEPTLCVSAAKFASRSSKTHGGGMSPSSSGGRVPGENTIWDGLFAELMRAIVLGPHSMQPRFLQALGEDYVNVHDDIRYFLLSNVMKIARQALADDEKLKEAKERRSASSPSPFVLPADSPLRGFQGTASLFTARATGSAGRSGSRAADSSPGAAGASKKKRRKKTGKKGCKEDNVGGNEDALVVESVDGAASRMDLAEINGRLARVLMVVRMVEEQSDLTAFLLPVGLSLQASSFSSSGSTTRHGTAEVGDGDEQELEGDASSSGSDSSDDETEGGGQGGEGGKKRRTGKGVGEKKAVGKSKGAGDRPGGGGETAPQKKERRMLAIERLRYHKKAFGDAWLACLRLPLPPALYRRVLLFLPGNVIPYMNSPVRLADFLTAAYGLGGVQSVLAMDALFLLMQAHDLEYPSFYDSLYRLVTPDMMYAKYRAKFFRMVDLCLTSSHVPAYVVAAFLKRFSRACLQAPPSGALFTLALVRKLIGRHPECLPLISSTAAPASRTVDRLVTSSGALSGTTGLKNRPLKSSNGASGGSDGTAGEDDETRGGFVDEYDPACEDCKGAGAMKTSLWELAALQNHYHPTVATLARGFLREADKKEAEGEAFSGPSKLAETTYQTLFEQEMRRKMGDIPLAFRRPNGLFDDIPEEGGGVFAAIDFSIS